MPTYTARCPQCGDDIDYIRRVAERDDTPNCPYDDTKLERVLTACMVPAMGLADHASVRSPIDGKMLYGKSDYLKHMKQHGVMPESEMRGEAAYQRGEREKKEKKERKEHLIKTVTQLIP